MTRGLADFSPSALRAWRLGVYARRGGASRTAEELAEAVGATKAQILAYENGHRVPDPPRIRALARALGVHPVYLMNRQHLEDWSIADLRRACGLRAEDVISDLGMSPKNYRRFENEGIVPSRRPNFLDEVAEAFGLGRDILERAIDATPAVRRRRRRVAELVTSIANRYVRAVGPWKGPTPDDPELQELAAAYGRPINRVRRIMAYELSELRQHHVRALRERVVADYDMDQNRQASASQAVRRWEQLFERELRQIPARLEQFHRNAQPSDVWQILVDLINVRAVPRADAPWAVTKFLTNSADCLSQHLVQQRNVDDVAVCKLTSAGYSHVTTFAGLYAALYPALRKPLRHPGREVSRARQSSLGIAFALPRHSAGTPHKLVIPTQALERLQTADSAKAVTLELSPRYLLTLQPNAQGSTIVATEAELPHEFLELLAAAEPRDG
jgi:transcriptional regulator with XRE-family HTH domain